MIVFCVINPKCLIVINQILWIQLYMYTYDAYSECGKDANDEVSSSTIAVLKWKLISLGEFFSSISLWAPKKARF